MITLLRLMWYYYYYYYYYKCHVLECCHHTVAGALYKNLDLKLLHSSMQMSAHNRSRRRHVSRMTDEKGETWSPSPECCVKAGQCALYTVSTKNKTTEFVA